MTSGDEVGMQSWIDSYMGLYSTGKLLLKCIFKRTTIVDDLAVTIIVLCEIMDVIFFPVKTISCNLLDSDLKGVYL